MTEHPFVMIDHRILECGLSPGAVLLYAVIMKYAWHVGGHCSIGNEGLVEETGISDRMVTQHLAELVAVEAVDDKRKGDGKNSWIIVNDPAWLNPEALQKHIADRKAARKARDAARTSVHTVAESNHAYKSNVYSFQPRDGSRDSSATRPVAPQPRDGSRVEEDSGRRHNSPVEEEEVGGSKKIVESADEWPAWWADNGPGYGTIDARPDWFDTEEHREMQRLYTELQRLDKKEAQHRVWLLEQQRLDPPEAVKAMRKLLAS